MFIHASFRLHSNVYTCKFQVTWKFKDERWEVIFVLTSLKQVVFGVLELHRFVKRGSFWWHEAVLPMYGNFTLFFFFFYII